MNALINEIVGREKKIISYASPEDSLMRRIVINSIELSTGRQKIEKAYNALKALNIQDASIWQHVFPLLGIELKFNREKVSTIHSSGPLLVIANHPYGVADGLAMGYLLSQFRNEFLLVVNEVLCREEMLGKYFLPIDFRENKKALHTNIETRKKAMSSLKDGGLIGIFPSGGVSTTPKVWKKKAEDLEWKNFVVKMVRQTGASVLPVYFKGQNSVPFQIASHIHPNLRLALLLNEVRRKRGNKIEFVIGDLISSEELAKVRRNQVLSYLKEKTFDLQFIQYDSF